MSAGVIGTKEPIEFFGAEVRFLDTTEGGRKGPLWPHAGDSFAGYRPDFRVSRDAPFHGCAFASAPLQINPGDVAVVELIFWCCERKHPDFGVGTEFELCEGPKVVAKGKILLKGSKVYVKPGAN
jgi:hypothetical protein